MTDIHQLENKMRSLKLNGMLDTLDLRLSQAQKDSIGFIQFLELLLEDEVQYRTNKRLASRISKAHFEEERSLEEFNFHFNPKVPTRYLKPDLLIVDDFALKELTKTQAEDLYELIDQRYRRGSMIVTANRSPKDWYPLFPNPVIAESALDRLLSCSHIITLTGKSYRALLRPDKALAKEVVTV
jgi:DNA replication protein DnaC